jgi:probable phosphoglycerate mutase
MAGQRLITRLYLVRHGESEAAAEDRFAGEIDVPLSERGREQARKLAQRLEAEPVQAVYSSQLARTTETARILAEPHGLEVRQRAELREISHGRWEGKRRSEVEAIYPEEYGRWDRDPFSFAPQGGETGLAVTARALPCLLEIVETHRGAQVLIASHKATIRLLLCSLLGFDPRRYRDRLDQSPAALNILDFRAAGEARLMLFNDTSHYSGTPSATPPAAEQRLSRSWDLQR